MKISVVLPCKNEAAAIGRCVEDIQEVLRQYALDAEVIVSDFSIDGSAEIAESKGVRVIKHFLDGYGNACRVGIDATKGQYIILADADGTYDFASIPRFIKKLDEGFDVVVGNRFGGIIDPGAMPFAHRYLGSPVLTGLIRIFFGTNIHDINSGMRAFRKASYQKLGLTTTGMEFASEMIIKTLKKGLQISEIPIHYHKRKGLSKLRTLSDGWRHLRFILLYSPWHLFIFPGLLAIFLGATSMLWLYWYPIEVGRIILYVHPLFISSLAIIVGYQIMIFGIFAQTYAMTHLREENKFLNKLYQYFTLEKAITLSIFFITIGAIIFLSMFSRWVVSAFGPLDQIKNGIVALTIFTIGIQTFFSAFMLSILSIKEHSAE